MPTTLKKPAWLDKKINLSAGQHLKNLLSSLSLNTVCRQAGCPNIGECFSRGEATFLILGKVCTRECRFCGVEKNELPETVDLEEPLRIAEAVKKLNLRHAVITSVTRDDLLDGGAAQFVKTIALIHNHCPGVTIEVLIPDFQLNISAIKKVAEVKPEIIGHNLETVPRLYASVRLGADYYRSLGVLRLIKELDSNIFTKSGLMLGLAETEDEVLKVFADLRNAGCDFLSLGQYLSPSLGHLPVQEYLSPGKFNYYKEEAEKLGFLYVASGPYVRSSYLAAEYINR